MIGDLKWNMVAGANGFQVISIMVSIILLIIEVCNEDDPSSIAHLIMLILAPFVGVIMLYIFNRTKTSCQGEYTLWFFFSCEKKFKKGKQFIYFEKHRDLPITKVRSRLLQH